MKNKPFVIAISGVKNSGKTTLIQKMIPIFNQKGIKVATIKHDGHDFECDIEDTDTFKHREAGAYGTAIFSKNKFMVIKEQKDTKEDELIEYFKDADLILLEGFKHSTYPKIEIIRKGNSEESVCREETLIVVATDTDYKNSNIKIIDLNDINSIINEIIIYMERNTK